MPLPFFNTDDPLGLKRLLGGGGGGTSTATKQPLVGTVPANGPAQNIYDAQTEQLKRKRALLDLSNPSNPYQAANNAAGRNLLELSNPFNPARQASTQAKRALIDATGRQSGMQRGYYGTVGGMIGERTAETAQLQNATHDVADLTAVAQAQGHRNAVNALRDSVGIARPIEINTPQGDATALPVGVARALRPNAEYVAENIRDKEAVRTNTLAALRNTLDIGNLDVGDVRRQGDIADLNLSEATQGASYRDKLSGLDLQDALDAGKYGYDSGALDLADASRAPFGKELWQDPETGESRYVTPAEKDRLDFAYQQGVQRERIPANYDLTRQRETYNGREDAGGSQFAAYDNADFINMLANTPTYGDTSEVNPSLAAIRAEIIRRLLLKGIPESVAEQTAIQQLQQFIGAAEALRKREEKAAGGGGYTTQ